jgi:hypothetical protein
MSGWLRRAEHLRSHGEEWIPERGYREAPQATTVGGTERQRTGPADNRGPGGRGQSIPIPAAVSDDCQAEPNVFRRVGDIWNISFEGKTVQLRDTRGLRYLAQLIVEPGCERHATTLITAEAPAPAARRSHVDGLEISADLGDAGAVLDAEATAQYRQRLTELREELDEAEAHSDLERATKLRDELAFLADQLASAGRNRRTASHAERARVTATKGILAAVKKIDAVHVELGRHLRATIRTGYFCSYTPDPRLPIEWLT